MKRVYLSILLLAFGLLAQAQNISVADFYFAENDQTARLYGTSRTDKNDNLCALIKVETTEKGQWAFDVGLLGIQDTEMQNAAHPAEIWVWVPYSVLFIEIQHDKLGKTKYYFPCSIDKGCTYIMKLTTAKINILVEEAIDQQFLVFNVTPPDAFVTVDGEPWPVSNGRAEKRVKLGKHEYRIEALDYHTEIGRVEVGPDKKEQKTITLKPAFGYLKIEGDYSVLSNATIYVDKAKGDDALKNGMKLSSGQHTLSVIHSKFKSYQSTVNIKDGETTTYKVVLGANYSTVTLKADDPTAEIYVDGAKMGIGSWTGDLVTGDYLVECRKSNHHSVPRRVTITDHMSGEIITLNPPIPINGRLVVTSDPSGAKISIDGQPMGETPLQLSAVLIGEHTLRLEKDGCAPVSETFIIEEGKTQTLAKRLDTGRSIVVKTDRKGDKIYVDGDYVGETPRETPLGFGHHTIRIMRNGVVVEKEVDVKESTRNGLELSFEFGRMVTIHTDHPGDIVYVDGNEVGKSPVSIDLPEGNHSIHAQRGKKYADKDIEVIKTGGLTEHSLVLHGETISHFVQNGVAFVTLNTSYDFMNTPSFGFCVGSVKKFGWFVTAMSNFQFDAMNCNKVADANGLVDGSYPSYSGTSSFTRISAIAGMMVGLNGPICLRFGAGYGLSQLGMRTTDGLLVKISNKSFQGVDATLGIQFNLKGFTLTADAVTTNFQTLEAKVGLGYCWKRK